MKTLGSMRDLEAYGLAFLTSEACALSQRLLFDMNEDGVALVAEYFGIPTYPLPAFADNWNSTVNGKPATAAIMLPRSPDFYRELYKFLLFREGYEVVIHLAGNMVGMSQAEYDDLPDKHFIYDTHHNPRPSGQPSVGTRNVHAMTGRTS